MRMTTACAVIIAVLSTIPAATGAEVVLEVSAGRHDRSNTPIITPLPDSLQSAAGLELVSLETGERSDVQLLPGERPQIVWLLRNPLPAGTSRKFRLQATDSAAGGAGKVTCEDNGKQLVLRVGDRPVLNYHHQAAESPSGIDPGYRRSGHIHPLMTPSGRSVTDDFPPDHAHQHGVFFAWVNTTFAGQHIDFWNQMGRTGSVEHAAIDELIQGPVFAQFRVRLRHSDITSSSGARPVLNETWVIRTYKLDQHFLVDMESTQSAVDEPLTINEYHYGGMGLRGSAQWYSGEGKGKVADAQKPGAFAFTTSEGKDRIAGNHTRPEWVSLSGNIDGAPATVTVMGSPENFRFPQPVRLHPTKPYFCFAPMVLGEFKLEKSSNFVSRYRFLVHDGALDQELNRVIWMDYAEPPAVRVVAGDAGN